MLRTIYRFVLPEQYRNKLRLKDRYEWYLKYRKIIQFYKNRNLTAEEHRALDFLRQHRYNLSEMRLLYCSDIVSIYQHKYKNVVVKYDINKELYYVEHEKKKLYFKQGLNENQIKPLYIQFLSELDHNSPHLYLRDTDNIKGGVLFDCGVAEGMFSLIHINQFDKIVLFECDEDWVKALNATFEPFKDKVTIVNKYLTNAIDDKSTTIDAISKKLNVQPSFIKMDIEGYEEKALEGAVNVLSTSKNIHCSIATYHTPDAEADITAYLAKLGYKPSFNKGLMVFHYENQFAAPYLRHGVVHYDKV